MADNQNMTDIEPDSKRHKFEDCVICYSPRHEMFVMNPCGHAKTCEICCLKIMYLPQIGTTCPICSENVTSYVKAFY